MQGWKRPLHSDLAKADPPGPRPGNAGLWYDKYVEWTRPEPGAEMGPGRNEDSSPRVDAARWIESVILPAGLGEETELNAYARRMETLAARLSGCSRRFRAETDFVTGLGRDHPTGNGLAWHHSLGVPYLPGSGVKGLARAWACEWQQATDEAFARIFGSEGDESAELDVGEQPAFLQAAAGSVVFLDAVPTGAVPVGCRVVTPHYGEYYTGGGHPPAPADWLSPTPVPFLAVQGGAELVFAVLPRRRLAAGGDGATSDCRTAMRWLEEALGAIGAGAKTAVGYGRFAPATPLQC